MGTAKPGRVLHLVGGVCPVGLLYPFVRLARVCGGAVCDVLLGCCARGVGVGGYCCSGGALVSDAKWSVAARAAGDGRGSRS